MRRRKPEQDRGKLQASPRTELSPASAGAVIDRGPGANAPEVPFRGLVKGTSCEVTRVIHRRSRVFVKKKS